LKHQREDKQQHTPKYGTANVKRGHVMAQELPKTGEDKHRLRVARYESMRQYVRQIDEALPPDSQPVKMNIEGHGEEWTWGDDLDKAKTEEGLRRGLAPSDAAREEYRRQKSKMKSVMAEAKDTVIMRSNRRRRIHKYAGGSINMNRYIVARRTGKPIPVFRSITRRCDTPTIRLAFNVALSHGNGIEGFLQTVAMAGALADCLTAEGFGVTVDAIDSCKKYHNGWSCIAIPVKTLEQPVNPERLMSCAYPGLLRDVGFRAGDLLFDEFNGQCVDMPDEIRRRLGYDCVLGKTWSEDEQRQRLLGQVQAVIADPNA
jgi:hypothetical protein